MRDPLHLTINVMKDVDRRLYVARDSSADSIRRLSVEPPKRVRKRGRGNAQSGLRVLRMEAGVGSTGINQKVDRYEVPGDSGQMKRHSNRWHGPAEVQTEGA